MKSFESQDITFLKQPPYDCSCGKPFSKYTDSLEETQRCKLCTDSSKFLPKLEESAIEELFEFFYLEIILEYPNRITEDYE